MNKQKLIEAGIEYEAGVKRFLDDAALYEDILSDFLSYDAFSGMERAFASGDRDALYECAHSLKGVGGNLSMTALYSVASALSELLRQGQCEEHELAAAYMNVKRAYRRAVEGIRAASEGERA